MGADLAAFAYIVAAVTMASIPALSWLGTVLFPAKAAVVEAELLPPDLLMLDQGGGPSVILAGYGRVGQTVATLLAAHRIPYLALDSDPRRVARARRAGIPVFYGDVTQPELLRRVGVAEARAVVVTVDDRARADEVVRIVRAENPAVLLIVRARDAAHAAKLYAAGASDAVPETIEASLQLAEAVLVDLGVPMGRVLVSIHEQRAAAQAEIKASAPDASIRLRGQVRLSAEKVVVPPG